jgi:hypothetical protein
VEFNGFHVVTQNVLIEPSITCTTKVTSLYRNTSRRRMQVRSDWSGQMVRSSGPTSGNALAEISDTTSDKGQHLASVIFQAPI